MNLFENLQLMKEVNETNIDEFYYNLKHDGFKNARIESEKIAKAHCKRNCLTAHCCNCRPLYAHAKWIHKQPV